MRRLAVLLFALLPFFAAAQGWHTTAPAVLYDAHSEKSKPLLILSGGFPLREISRVDGWHKVTGYGSQIGWVRADLLKPSRRAVVDASRAAARSEPHAAAAAVFFAKRGVVLEVLAVQQTPEGRRSGWLKVLHPDGEVAFLLETEVWLNF